MQCSASFTVTPSDLAFYAEIGVAQPTECPDCRSLLRCSHRNERSLFKRSCSLCAREIVAMFPPEAEFPVYCPDCFFSDRWDPLAFGQSYREDRPFFEQMASLLQAVPHLSIINKQTENSAYSNYSFANKNCYLTFGSHYEEDCLYGAYSTKNRDCVDCLWIYGSELLYESLFLKNCYRSLFVDFCADCSDCAFCWDSKGCRHCLFCSNLAQREYCIFNEQLSPEEYELRLRSYRLDTWSGLEEAKTVYRAKVLHRFPVRAIHLVQCEDCEGDTLTNCKNMRQCFFGADSEDCAYGLQVDGTYHAMDIDYMGYDRSERLYQEIGCLGLFDCIACNACWHGSGLRYCQSCFSCNDCFGCVSLRQKKHCILNRAYAPDEYRRITSDIAKRMQRDGSWGTFFPAALTPFAYNETMAKDWFPLTEEEAKRRGYRWKSGDEMPDVARFIDAAQLPERIEDIPDDVLQWAIRCAHTGRPYRIVKRELDFYREMHLPLPRFHPEERHRLRIGRRNPRKLWDRQCAKCGKGIATSYAPDRPEIVYCEECYLATVY